MAPEAEVLKRQRSRPSDWWAAKTSSSTPQQPKSTPPKAPAPEASQKESSKASKAKVSAKMAQADAFSSQPEVGSSLKRKRSRPSEWWAADTSSLTPQQAEKSKVLVKGMQEAPAAGNRGKGKARKGRDNEGENGDGDELAEPAKRVTVNSQPGRKERRKEWDSEKARKKRGRPPAERVEQQDELDSQPVQQLSRKRRRQEASRMEEHSEERTEKAGKPRRRLVGNSDVERAAKSSGHEEEERGKRRTRNSDIVPTEPEVEEQFERGRTRTRKSDGVVEVVQATSTLTKGRPATKKLPAAVASRKSSKAGPAPTQAPNPTKQKKASNEAAAAVSNPKKGSSKSSKQPDQLPKKKRKSVDRMEKGPAKKRRVSKAAQQEVEVSEAEEELPYQHIAAVTRKVSRQTIETKWEPLPPNCVERIAQLLSDIQRPVIVRLNDERKRTQASTALQMVSRRLVSKISKGLPFPPGTRNHREDDFDFEKILDHNRFLEAQLTPALHANELLESELNKELAWLEAEKEKLEELESNAKAEAATRKQASKKLHSVLQTSVVQDMEGFKEDFGLQVAFERKSSDSQLDSSIDEDLTSLVKALEGHVDSIQGNMKQVHGITEAIAKSKAAVQSTLFSHLDGGQYQDVVLG